MQTNSQTKSINIVTNCQTIYPAFTQYLQAINALYLYYYEYNTKYIPLYKVEKPFLFCKIKPVTVVYLRSDLANVLMPEDFKQVMVMYMKREFAIVFGKNLQLSQLYEGRAVRALRKAKFNDVTKIKNYTLKTTDFYMQPENFGVREV